MNLDEMVSKYIELRDKKARLKAAYETKAAKLDDVLKKIEGVLLKTFNETGMESVRTDAGTAYKQVRTGCTVADWDSFFAFVQAEGAWEMLEHRASKIAVEQYRAANEDIPPGLNWREEVVINVRRS